MFKYIKLSQYKIRKIIFYFSKDLTATQVAESMKISRVTINRYYKLIREKIVKYSETQNGFEGELELD